MCPDAIRVASKDIILLARWVVLRANYKRRTLYELHRDGFNCQLAPYFSSIASKYRVLTLRTLTKKLWRNYFSRVPSIGERCLTERRKATDDKTDLNATICRSVQFRDQIIRHADDHGTLQSTAYTHKTNRKPRFVITTDVLSLAT